MLNQVIKECFKETIKHVRRVIYAKQAFVRVFARISRTFPKCNQVIKVNFCPSKILILVADGSGLMKVTTPCMVYISRVFHKLDDL